MNVILDKKLLDLANEILDLHKRLDKHKERAEDAEADRDEARMEAMSATRELDEAKDKLADAYRQIAALKQYAAAQKVIAEKLRAKLFPLEGSSPTFSPRQSVNAHAE
jgi:chromosome segregation ATPase